MRKQRAREMVSKLMWGIPVILALSNLRQEDCLKFKGTPVLMARPCVKICSPNHQHGLLSTSQALVMCHPAIRKKNKLRKQQQQQKCLTSKAGCSQTSSLLSASFSRDALGQIGVSAEEGRGRGIQRDGDWECT